MARHMAPGTTLYKRAPWHNLYNTIQDFVHLLWCCFAYAAGSLEIYEADLAQRRPAFYEKLVLRW